jgi:hypothetical protein
MVLTAHGRSSTSMLRTERISPRGYVSISNFTYIPIHILLQIQALSPASASWQVSAHSEDGSFPTTFHELERIPISDIVDGFIDTRRLGAGSIYVKTRKVSESEKPSRDSIDSFGTSPSAIYSHYDAFETYGITVERSAFSPISPEMEDNPDFILRLSERVSKLSSKGKMEDGGEEERTGLRDAAKQRVLSAAQSVGRRAEKAVGKADRAVDKVLSHFAKSPVAETENAEPRSSLEGDGPEKSKPRLFLPKNPAEMHDLKILPGPRSASPEPIEITVESSFAPEPINSARQLQLPPSPNPSRSPGLPSHPAMHVPRSPFHIPVPTLTHRRAHSANPSRSEFDRNGFSGTPGVIGTSLCVGDAEGSWNSETLFAQPRRAPVAPGDRGRPPTSPRTASLDRYDNRYGRDDDYAPSEAGSDAEQPRRLPALPTSPRTASLDRYNARDKRRGMAGFGFDFDLERKPSKKLPPLPRDARIFDA